MKEKPDAINIAIRQGPTIRVYTWYALVNAYVINSDYVDIIIYFSVE